MKISERIELDNQPTLLRGRLQGFRIAVESYGPVAPVPRGHYFREDVGSWNRFDTPGRTIYAAETRRGAFTECLYDKRLDHGSRSAIAFMADAFGDSWEDAFARYADEQRAQGHPVPGTLPATWRTSRKVYELHSDNELLWFDLTTEHSLSYLDRTLGPEIHKTCGITSLDASHLLGDNRLLTTLIATSLRSRSLPSGTQADGIYFNSRHGVGPCWAFWMRRTDDELDNDLVVSSDGEAFSAKDDDFNAVAKRFDIQIQ